MPRLTSDEILQAQTWNKYAADRGYLQTTIDPRDTKGLKCDYINRWSTYYIRKYVAVPGVRSAGEIGCGSGRNVFNLRSNIDYGAGIDIAEKQIENANQRKAELGANNLKFYSDAEEFIAESQNIDCLFTMWLLSLFSDDANLFTSFGRYIDNMRNVRRHVFFEQVTTKPYTITEEGYFYKKVRTKEEFVELFDRLGLRVTEHHILDEKGFGPIYRFLYHRHYGRLPVWLNLNPIAFPLDRLISSRKVRERFTDSVFICERKN